MKIKPLTEKKADAIDFVSERGILPYRSLRECVEMIFGQYNYEFCQELTSKIGTYQVDDQLVAKLKQKRIALVDGIIPFASTADYLDRTLLDKAYDKSYSISQIADFMKNHNLVPEIVYIHAESVAVLLKLEGRLSQINDLYKKIDFIDSLECHRNPILSFSCRRIS